MKAYYLIKPSPIEEEPLILRETKLSELNKNEVLIEIEECGICKIDLQIIEGKWSFFNIPMKIPVIPCHEAIGRILDIGEGIEKFKVNDYVALGLIHSSCNECKHCISGKENLCQELKIRGENIDGVLAKRVKVDGKYILKVPREFKENATLIVCPLAFAIHAMNLINGDAESIACIGDDPICKFLQNLAKIKGIEAKLVLRKRDLDSKEDEIDFKMLKNQSFDAIYISESNQDLAKIAFKSLNKGGKMITSSSLSLDMPHFFEGKQIILSGIPSYAEMHEAFRIAKKIDFSKIEKRYFKFEEVYEALKYMKYGGKGKAIVRTKD